MPPPDCSSARILIVDDQPSNVRLLEHTLRRGGFLNVSSTTEPREVASLHAEHRYDLILLDLQMPPMTGYEVMQAISAGDVPRAAILVMSADPAQKIPALQAGADSFLSKPFVLAEVVAHVRAILERPTAAQAET
jgi:DNA-binding response OmpR family regulator